LKEFFEFKKFFQVRFKQDNLELNGKVLWLVILNGPSYGKIFKIAKGADLRDGVFDVCWIRYSTRPDTRGKILLKALGFPIPLPEMKRFRTSSFKVSSPENLCCQMDGEILPPKKEFEIRTFKKALKVLVPK